MATYCGECALWRGSSDENRYGERWCSYSRRYEKADQETYGCRGFVAGTRRYLHELSYEEWKTMETGDEQYWAQREREGKQDGED